MTEMIEGKSLKFKDAAATPTIKRTGIVYVNDAELNASELTYNVDVTPDKDSILTITDATGEKQYRFVKKHGFGGLFGLSADVQNFLNRIDEETKISEKYVRIKKEISEKYARIEKEIDDFNNDRHDLYSRINGLDNYVLKKGELFAMATLDVDFYQEKTKRIAATTGTSIRIAKGVTWRVGGAAPLEKTEYTHMDTGTLVCTNQRLVFIGSMKTVTIPLGKIVGIDEFSDAIQISKEGATKKYAFIGIRGNVWAAGVRSMCREFNQ